MQRRSVLDDVTRQVNLVVLLRRDREGVDEVENTILVNRDVRYFAVAQKITHRSVKTTDRQRDTQLQLGLGVDVFQINVRMATR